MMGRLNGAQDTNSLPFNRRRPAAGESGTLRASAKADQQRHLSGRRGPERDERKRLIPAKPRQAEPSPLTRRADERQDPRRPHGTNRPLPPGWTASDSIFLSAELA